MNKKTNRMELTDELAAKVTGGTGKAEEVRNKFQKQVAEVVEGSQIVVESYQAMDARRIGNEPQLLQAPQGSLEGLQKLMVSESVPGSGPAPGLVPPGASDSGAPPVGGPPPEAFGGPPPESFGGPPPEEPELPEEPEP